MFLLLLSSLLMFTVNGVCIEIIKEVFGPTPVMTMASLAVCTLGFAVGLTMIKKSLFETFMSNCLGICFLVIGCLLTPLQLSMMGSPWLGYLFALLCFFASLLCGRSAVRFIYSERPERNSQRYGIFYFTSALFVLLCLFFANSFGKDHILIAVGILTLTFSYVEQKKHRDRFFTYHLGFSREAFFLGVITGCCLGVYLLMISWLFRSSGAEFLIYLFITWLFLGLSPFIHRIFGFKPLTYALLGLCLFLISLNSVVGLNFWKTSPLIFIDLAEIKQAWLGSDSPTLLSMGLLFSMGLIFFLPMACIIPAFESEDQSRNYLYSNSLGHFFAFLFLGLLGFVWLYPLIILIFIVACVIGLRDHGFTFIRKPLFFVLIVLICLAPPNLEERVLQQVQRSRPSCNGCEIENFNVIDKSKGLLGFIGSDKNETHRFGINEAQYPVFDIYDYQKAFVAQDFINKKQNRVLLLGLGNHALYQQLLDHRQQSGIDFKIDVVEPLPQFKNINFRLQLGAFQGWNHDDKRDVFAFDRVIDFLLRSSSGSYDLILWNLPENLSMFSQSRLTLEFFKEVHRVQDVNGYFIAPHYEKSNLACFIDSIYNSVGSYPRMEVAPASVLIATNNTNWSESKITACSEFQSPRISGFFFQRQKILDRQRLQLARSQVPEALPPQKLNSSKAMSFAQALNKEKRTLVTVLPLNDAIKTKTDEFLYGLRQGMMKMKNWQILPLTCNELNLACTHKIFSFSKLNSTSSVLAPFRFASQKEDTDINIHNRGLGPILTIEPSNKKSPLFKTKTLLSNGLEEVLKWMRRSGRGSNIKVVDLSNQTHKFWSQGEWLEQEVEPDSFVEIIDEEQLENLRPGSINNINRGSRFLFIKGAIKSRREFNKIRLYYENIFFFPGHEIGLVEYCEKARKFERLFKRRPDYFMELGYQFAEMRDPSKKMELVSYDTRSMDLKPLNASSTEICDD